MGWLRTGTRESVCKLLALLASWRLIGFSSLRKQPFDHPFGLREIAAAEEIEVVQHVVQVVEMLAP